MGFRDQESMYQALVSHFELFDNFVTNQNFITAEKMFSLMVLKFPGMEGMGWGGGGEH